MNSEKNSNEANHSQNVIEVKDVSFWYENEEILKSITLDIHRGDYLGVVGSNGAGKTTLIKIILGLLQPDSGSIKLFGKDIKEFKEWSKVGYVPQKATNFDVNFPATVAEVVMMGRYAKKGLFKYLTNEDKQIVEKSLSEVTMLGFKNRLIGDLSAGQQQRVFIARALAGQPEIIFLDEPTTGVDKRSRDDFYRLLQKLNKELHITLVLITHDVERILKEAMHIACIDHRLVCHSSPEEFLRDNPSLNLYGQEVRIIEHHHSSG